MWSARQPNSHFVGDIDYVFALKKKFKSLVSRKWKFVEFLDDYQLEKLVDDLPEYGYVEPVVVGPNEEETR